MPNVFDQFDPPQARTRPNVFDQFDVPQPQAVVSPRQRLGAGYTAPAAPLSLGRGLLHGLAEGISLGGVGELGAAMGDTPGVTFSQRLSAIEAPYRAFREEHPLKALGAEIAGGIMSGVGIPGVIRRVVPASAGLVGRMVGTGGTALGRGVRSTAVQGLGGAGIGGTVGALSAEEGERLAGALTGGILGGGIGAALPVAGAGAKLLGNLGKAAFRGAESTAKARAQATIAKSGLSREALQARRAEIGPEAMLADLTPGLTREAEVTVARGGAGSQAAEAALIARKEGAAVRIDKILRENIGKGQDWMESKKALKAETDAMVKPAYDAVRNTEVAIDPSFVRSPDFTRAVRGALRIAGNEGKEADVEALRRLLKAEGQPVSVKIPSIDYVKRSLFAIEDTERGQARLAGKTQTPLGRSVGDLRVRLVDSIDSQLGGKDPAVNPYLAARKIAQGPERDNAAFQWGRQFARHEPEEIAEKLADMSDSEKLFVRLAVMRGLRARMNRGREKAAALREDAGLTKKLEMILGDDYPETRRLLDAELTMRGTETTALAGSPTARRLLGAEEQAQVIPPDAGGLMARILNAAQTGVSEPSGEAQQILAKLLTARGTALDDVLASVPQVPGVQQSILNEALRRGAVLGPVMGLTGE